MEATTQEQGSQEESRQRGNEASQMRKMSVFSLIKTAVKTCL
jgi:hypothetical protein